MRIPVAKEGLNLIKICLLIVVGFYILGSISLLFRFVSLVFLVLSLFLLYFFRDPERKITVDEKLILSPADGKIIDIIESEDKRIIKIFMSVLNVHIQRAPLEGEIIAVEYKPGKFLNAGAATADEVNEQNIIVLQDEKSKIQVLIKQIAGVLARRIVCRVRKGDIVKQGQRIGMIKLGSQVDIIIPKNIILCVNKGECVKGGCTIIGKVN